MPVCLSYGFVPVGTAGMIYLCDLACVPVIPSYPKQDVQNDSAQQILTHQAVLSCLDLGRTSHIAPLRPTL